MSQALRKAPDTKEGSITISYVMIIPLAASHHHVISEEPTLAGGSGCGVTV